MVTVRTSWLAETWRVKLSPVAKRAVGWSAGELLARRETQTPLWRSAEPLLGTGAKSRRKGQAPRPRHNGFGLLPGASAPDGVCRGLKVGGAPAQVARGETLLTGPDRGGPPTHGGRCGESCPQHQKHNPGVLSPYMPSRLPPSRRLTNAQ